MVANSVNLLSNSQWALPAVVSASLYITPIIFRYLSTEPDHAEGRNLNFLDTQKVQLAQLHRRFVRRFGGERDWNRFAAVVVDNAWIAGFVVAYLAKDFEEPLNFERSVQLTGLFIAVSGMSWITRYAISKVLPPVTERTVALIAPRNLGGDD